MLRKKNAVVYSDSSGEQVSTLCGQNTKTVSIKCSGTYAQKQLSFNEEIGAALYRNVLFSRPIDVGKLSEKGGGGKREPTTLPPILFIPKNIFLLATKLKMGKKKFWGDSGKEGVCIYKTGSNLSSPSF